MKNKANKSYSPVTSVNGHLGSPVFILDGQPFMKPVFETYVPETKYFKEFANVGCSVYSFSTNLADGFGPPLWIAPDEWDFSELDARAHRVLEADMDGLIMPRILLSTPLWWREQNPDELMVLDNGEKSYPKGKPSVTPVERTFESIASEKWRKDMAYGLLCVIEHIQQSDYADNIFGYMITGLMTEEWYHWSSGMGILGDYSVHYVKRFREWLKKKYVSASELQKAWNNPMIDFNSAEIPSRIERFGDPTMTFRDLKKQMNVIDFYQFHNEMIPDTIDYFAKAAKDVTKGTKVVGAFYGFMFEFCGDPEFGHNAMGKFLESPNLDFIMVTSSYGYRQLGSGLDYERAPSKSVALHNKLWYHDNDTISSRYREVMKGWREETINHEAGRLGGTETPQESFWMYRRGAGLTLGKGFYESLFDLHGGYFSDPQLLDEIKKLYVLLDESRQYDKSSCSEVLIVADEASCNYVVFPRNRNGMGWWNELIAQTFMHTQPSLYKFGAPHDSILVNDLELVDIEQYKLVIFLNTYNLNDKQRELINSKVKQEGKTVLWVYAPGLFNESKTSIEAMEELTGIKIVPSEDETFIAPRIALIDGNHHILRDMKYSGYTFMGPENRSCKLFSVKDSEAIAIGRLSGTNDITLAFKNVDGWTSIYAITPTLPPEFYRSLAMYAGVHIYNDKNDTLYANKSYLTICADKEGIRTIRFPHRVDVFDPFSNERLYNGVDEFTRYFREKEALLLRYCRQLKGFNEYAR